MNDPVRKSREHGAIEILEDSINLLRSAGSAAIALYLAGAVPFAVGLLYFWTDMARNPFASERLAGESLGVAALLLWKNVWQALFQARLYRRLSASDGAGGPVPDSPEGSSSARILRLIAVQSALQPLGWIAIPLSATVAIPFAWTVAFFRNAGMFAALGADRPVAEARRQAGLWSAQNWLVLGVVSLAAMVLFANVLITIMAVPQIGRSFLGIEGELARLGAGLLNLTTIMVAATITWMFVDPLLDAVYALRCFYGESITSGEDLLVGLRRALAAAALMLAIAAGLATGAPSARAQVPSGDAAPAVAPVQTPGAIDTGQLNDSIQEVVRRREFAWRFPKPSGEEPQGRWVGWVRGALRTIRKAADWVVEKIRNWFRSRSRTEPRGGAAERPALEIWIAIAGLLLAGGLAAMLYFRGRPARAAKPSPVQAAPVSVDLSDESVTADQMPESAWRRLADEWLAKGDCRLALRALYLAGLNDLSARGLLSIRRSKSGGDYRRELERRLRAHAAAGAALRPAFARNVALFERGWYGRHAVERADVDTLVATLEEMKQHAGGA